MRRFITKELENWKNSPHRKPLILRGARQVGKTYIVKRFGEDFYNNIAYFNFDHDEALSSLFTRTKDPRRLIEQLSLASGQKIAPGSTLIFFDEIQECPDALNSLKYFQEESPEYHIICAGSLLGVRLSHASFPVGKVDFLHLSPMSFSEFLLADNCQHLVDYMRQLDAIRPVEAAFAQQLEEKLKSYFIVGGMPEVVSSWVTEKDITRVNYLQESILTAYEQDFAKHTTDAEANKISLIWHGIPSQLARENKKFVYQAVKPGARAREYEGALNWLSGAGLIHKIHDVKKPAFPLSAYQDLSAFKLYLNDIGLLCQMSGLDSSIIVDGDRLFTEFKGALIENYCLNTLRSAHFRSLHYHTFDRFEVDFLTQWHNQIIPIECKAGATSPHTSLTRYNNKYQPTLSVRFSTHNLTLDGQILNVPLYLAEYLRNFLPDKI